MAAIIGWLALSFAVSFLLGSIPWGVIVSKLAYHKDIRDEGSGNIGTTNAFRAMGKVGGALVFVLDFGKGLLSGWLAFWFWAPLAGWAEIDYSLAGATLPATVEGLPVDAGALALALAFAGCTLGHIFSPWLKFKGGKGIAVAAACLVFVFGPVGFLIEIAAFALGIAITRCVSVGSIAAAAICPHSPWVRCTIISPSIPSPKSRWSSTFPSAPTTRTASTRRRQSCCLRSTGRNS